MDLIHTATADDLSVNFGWKMKEVDVRLLLFIFNRTVVHPRTGGRKSKFLLATSLLLFLETEPLPGPVSPEVNSKGLKIDLI
jgi:hypothetical protein